MLLLEAGGKDDYLWIHIPVGYLYCIGNPRTDWLYRTEADAGLNGRSLIYPRGKVLGGSSSINGMIYMRGQAHDYDQWAELTGDPGWRWDQVLPLFKKTEDYLRRRRCVPWQRRRMAGGKAAPVTGTSWMPSAMPPNRPASPRPTTSTAATTTAAATSTSTSAAASAGTRPRPS